MTPSLIVRSDVPPEIYSTKAKEAANRWTENIFIFQSYCVGKFNVDRSEFNKNFNISDEMDTLP
ncbi:hypothetical protein BGZ99_004045 [Dissophora globulifera]|uniref:Leucine zipper with capping helix domain-containing protein n=1 Tax=Dissophora globulifera TaxID=979702 RepID=A0A9P6UVA7_9FUNG|nr:hypothetical protein BGZ99_004045 [Dissophora globulifera]